MKNNAKYFYILVSSSSILYNYFDILTKLFSYLYSAKFLDTAAKLFFPCRIEIIRIGFCALFKAYRRFLSTISWKIRVTYFFTHGQVPDRLRLRVSGSPLRSSSKSLSALSFSFPAMAPLHSARHLQLSNSLTLRLRGFSFTISIIRKTLL